MYVALPSFRTLGGSSNVGREEICFSERWLGDRRPLTAGSLGARVTGRGDTDLRVVAALRSFLGKLPLLPANCVHFLVALLVGTSPWERPNVCCCCCWRISFIGDTLLCLVSATGSIDTATLTSVSRLSYCEGLAKGEPFFPAMLCLWSWPGAVTVKPGVMAILDLG